MDSQSPPPGGSPFSPSGLNPLRLQTLLLGELYRIQRGVLEALLPGPTPPSTPGTSPAPIPGDDLYPLLRRLQLLTLLHPIATQAAFSALVAEGRRFAETPEGKPWVAGLAASEPLRRAGPLWETLGLGMLEEDPNTVLPSAYLETLLGALRSPGLEALVARLREAMGEKANVPG